MTKDKDRLEPDVSRPNVDEVSEDEIDRNLMGSFPASDPPSWTLGIERDRQPASDKQKE
jgi:hypothetical protein